MTKVGDYVTSQLEDFSATELADRMKISLSMVTQYKKRRYDASINVAVVVYNLDGTVLFPFAEEALKELSL